MFKKSLAFRILHKLASNSKINPGNKKTRHYSVTGGNGGGEENRTPVQTYSSKAFYMFILF